MGIVVRRSFATGLLCAILVLTSGCMRVSGSITKILGSPDFKKSELTVSGTAVANGSDQLIVYAHLLNSDNSVVSGYKPTYTIISGGSVVPNDCFTSDQNGLSICIVKALTAGTRTLKIQNITTIDLEQKITFLPIPTSNNMLQIVSGSNQKAQAGPYIVKGSVGNVTSNLKQTAGNYVVYGSVQGALTSSSP